MLNTENNWIFLWQDLEKKYKMIKFYKALSLVLHPVFLPLVGAGVYLCVLPLPLLTAQKYFIFLVVVGATLVLPLITLFLLKKLGYVKSNQAETIEERKIPVVIMIANYIFLASVLQEVWQLRELVILSYATATCLLVTNILFYFKTKVSLHMIGIAGLLGFTIAYGVNYTFPNFTIAFLVVLVGLLATARLQLKAHNFKEIILGTSLGVLLPIVMNVFL